MSPLAALIQEKNREGLSYREMSMRADRAGLSYSDSQFENVAKDRQRRRLTASAIAAIAAGLRETPERIRQLDDQRWNLASGASGEASDAFRYQRPPGLTDAQWATMKSELNDYIEYQIAKAARER